MRKVVSWTALAIALVLITTSIVQAGLPLVGRLSQGTQDLGTAFTYQGHLAFTNGPVTDTCDMRFDLFDNVSGGNQIGETNIVPTVVEGGLFSAQLDFGEGSFDGSARFIEIAVGCPAGANIVSLSPRQPISPSPYAIFSGTAGRVSWDGVEQVPAGFADGVDADTLDGLDCELGQTPLFGDGGWACIDAGASVSIIDLGNLPHSYSDIATGVFGVMAYLRGEELQITSCNDRRCSSPTTTLLTNDAKTPISIAATPEGKALVAFRGFNQDQSPHPLRLGWCNVANCDNASVITIDDRTVGLVALAVSGDGRPVMAYVPGLSENSELAVAVCEDAVCSAWSGAEVSLTEIQAVSVAVMPTGVPVVAYVDQHDGAKEVLLLVCQELSCTQSTEVSIDTMPGQLAIHVTVGGDGLPLVAVLQRDGTEVHLWRYHCLDVLCSANVASSSFLGSVAKFDLRSFGV